MAFSDSNAATALGGLTYNNAPQKYTTLDTLVDGTREDVRDIYAAIYGDQGLSGLVEVIGAKKSAGTADEAVWYEEGHLGRTITVGSTNTVTHVDGEAFTAEADAVRPNDVIMKGDQVLLVTAVSSTALTAVDMVDGSDETTIATGDWSVIGNAYAQGTDQPSKPFQNRLTRRANPYTIVKESFHVTGSQATNVGYVNVGGQTLWYLKGELDARRKFMNMREAMMVFGKKNNKSDKSFGGGVPSSEGYVQAVSSRGTVSDALADAASISAFGTAFDAIIVAADKQGLPSENALYVNRELSIDFDNFVSTSGVGGTGPAMNSFGAFNNSADMAITMGFKSFTRGGYTFHKHDWKLLNDEKYGAGSTVNGAIIPLSIIVDAKTGNRHHSLEMNYKSAGSYSRELEHWVEGGNVLGYNTGGEDLAKFHYRSECNLCVRGANQHVLFVD